MTRSLHVALVTSARTWRGSGVSLSEIAIGLRRQGHGAHMIAGDPAVLEGFAAAGLPTAQIPTGSTSLLAALALRAHLRAVRADVLVADRPRDLRLGTLAAAGLPTRVVYRYNLSRPTPSRDVLSRLSYRRARLTIFPSHASARAALAASDDLPRRPWRVIPNGVDTRRFRPDPGAGAEFRVQAGLGDVPFVLAAGALSPEKRLGYLLRVMAALGTDAPPLVLCGDGPLRESLCADAADLGVDLRCLGLLSPSALCGAYSAAAVVLHAGAVETFGLSVLEAMACGAAVIGVDAGAVPEVLGSAGCVVSVDDVPAFAVAVRNMLSNPTARAALGAAARRRAVECFPLERMHREYVEAVEAVCR